MRLILWLTTMAVIIFMVYYGLRVVQLGTQDLLGEEVSLEAASISRQENKLIIIYAGECYELDLEGLVEIMHSIRN